jgi:membrane-associated phospholipid phosphatase
MEDRPPRLSSSTLLARILSIAGHPLVLLPLLVAVATRNRVWTAILVVCTILPFFAVTLRNVRRGLWSDHDVSRRDQRVGLYRVAFPLFALSAVVIYFLDAGPQMMRGFGAAAVMMGLGIFGNRWLKISMHMMTAACCAVVIGWLYPISLWAAVPFVAAVAWSRHKLGRHTWAEIAVGLAIGAAAGLFVVAV